MGNDQTIPNSPADFEYDERRILGFTNHKPRASRVQKRKIHPAHALGAIINGVTNHLVEKLTLTNVTLTGPGGGGGTDEDAKKELPEREAAYPEYNMFGRTLPAYGIYARHVRGLNLQSVRIVPTKPDARPATLFLDIEGVTPANFQEEISLEL